MALAGLGEYVYGYQKDPFKYFIIITYTYRDDYGLWNFSKGW